MTLFDSNLFVIHTIHEYVTASVLTPLINSLVDDFVAHGLDYDRILDVRREQQVLLVDARLAVDHSHPKHMRRHLLRRVACGLLQILMRQLLDLLSLYLFVRIQQISLIFGDNLKLLFLYFLDSNALLRGQ